MTVARHAKSDTEDLRVNRMCKALVSPSGVGSSTGCPTWLIEGTKLVLSVLVCALSSRDFLPAVTKCPFLPMWGSLLGGLARESSFGVTVNQVYADGGHFEANESEAVRIITLAYYHRDARAFLAG